MAIPFLLDGSWDSGFGSAPRQNRMEGSDAEGREPDSVGIIKYK